MWTAKIVTIVYTGEGYLFDKGKNDFKKITNNLNLHKIDSSWSFSQHSKITSSQAGTPEVLGDEGWLGVRLGQVT